MTPPQPDTPAPAPQPDSGQTAATATRPEPVLNAATAAASLTSLAGVVLLVLVFTHVITPEGQAVLGPALASAIPTVVGAVATLVGAFHARQRTLPLGDPRVAEAWAQILDAEQRTQAAIQSSAAMRARPPGPQTPGVADHAAPDTPQG